MGIAQQWQENLFKQVHGNHLVYNTCWEDPRCDRRMLGIGPDSRVVVLTSAGCNALDYLLDNPASVHCVDMNLRQNALLELKISLFQHGQPQLLQAFFLDGAFPDARDAYRSHLRARLSPSAKAFWDRKIGAFDGKGLRKSFYWTGTCGTIAWLVVRWLRSHPDTHRAINTLFAAQNLDEQRAAYQALEPRLLSPFIRWFVRQHLVQSMLGVPKSQQTLASATYEEGMAGYVLACLKHVFTVLPLQDNYFWKVYYYGRYTATCCPNYLLPEHFHTLQERTRRVSAYTGTLSAFLKQHPGQYTHFVLLDHQDWLAENLRPALEEEWRLILANAAPGARFLLRSAAAQPDVVPDFVRQRITFDLEAAADSQANDRVGTYAGTFFGVLNP